MMKIGEREIGTHVPPFVVAEMSGNHNQSLERALAIVEAAANAGVDAVKLQTYTPDTMTLDIAEREFVITSANSPWKGLTLYELFRKAHTPWEWHEPIFKRCRELGVIGFSTPFDASAVDFLLELDVPAFKIASAEAVDLPLIRKAAAAGKPVILSSGMASLAELDEAIQAARQAGCKQIALLKCTADYPAGPEDANLRTIPRLRELFGVEVGISDHTSGLGTAVTAVAIGAAVVEKHLTLSRADGGIDAFFSAEPEEIKALVQASTTAWRSLGSAEYGLSAAEAMARKSRRSLYVVKDVRCGDVLTESNVKAIRPGLGLPPKFYCDVVGRAVNRDIARGTPLEWRMIG